MSISGDILVVGNPRAFDVVGCAQIYRSSGEEWVLEAELSADFVDVDDKFGDAVAVSGDVVVVADPSADAPGDGPVYVYRYLAGEWQLEQNLSPSHPTAHGFGRAVAIDGNTIVVGARSALLDGVVEAGAAFVFSRRDGRWVEEVMLTRDEPHEDDFFGDAVDVHQGVIVVGGFGIDNYYGGVTVFRRNDNEWVEEQALPFESESAQPRFGTAVAVRGNLVVAGAPQSHGQAGEAAVYRYNGRRWEFEAGLVTAKPAGEWAFLGSAVAIHPSEQTVVAGAPDDWEGAFDGGAVHVFAHESGQWIETAKLLASNPEAFDDFGESVAVDGDVAVVGMSTGAVGRAFLFAGMIAPDCNDNGEPDSCDLLTGMSLDANANGIPDECEAPGDVDGDGVVGIADLIAVLLAWGDCPVPCPPACPHDITADCSIDVDDLVLVILNWSP